MSVPPSKIIQIKTHGDIKRSKVERVFTPRAVKDRAKFEFFKGLLRRDASLPNSQAPTELRAERCAKIWAQLQANW